VQKREKEGGGGPPQFLTVRRRLGSDMPPGVPRRMGTSPDCKKGELNGKRGNGGKKEETVRR